MAAGLLNRLHQAISMISQQNGLRDLKADEKDIAINNSQKDLFLSLVQTYINSDKLPDLLEPLS